MPYPTGTRDIYFSTEKVYLLRCLREELSGRLLQRLIVLVIVLGAAMVNSRPNNASKRDAAYD